MKIFITIYFARMKAHYDSNSASATEDISEEVQKAKKEAELVMTGRLIRQFDKANEENYQHFYGLGFWEMSVESVERGTYAEDTITIGIGSFDNMFPQELFPSYLKKHYSSGDRARVYLFFNSKEKVYYTPCLWWTIEPP